MAARQAAREQGRRRRERERKTKRVSVAYLQKKVEVGAENDGDED